MKKAEWKNKRLGFFFANTLGIALFVIIAVMVVFGLGQVDKDSLDQGRVLLEESLYRAAANCYAIEGRYPPSLDYLTENYGVIIDGDKYAVHYANIFASNIMPEITVVPLEDQ